MSDLNVTQRSNGAVDQLAEPGEVWPELQECYNNDVLDIAEWSRSRTSVQGAVLADRAVRHGLNMESTKRLCDSESLKTFLDLHEQFVSRCIDQLPRQAKEEDVKRAFSATVDHLWNLGHSNIGMCATFAFTTIMATCGGCTWWSNTGVAIASIFFGLVSAVAFLFLLLRR